MEIDWIEDFLALSTEGVFAKAADARNISQSAFTRRIKNLEYWIGTPLFERSVHPVTLTPAGEMFLPVAHDVVGTLGAARAEARGLVRREAEVLDFIALHTLAISFFPHWINELGDGLDAVRSRVQSENFSGCVEALLSGASDFMLCYHHPAIPMKVDDVRYPSVQIAEDTIMAVSCVDKDGKAKFNLEGDGSFPFLAYTRDSFLGKITNIILERTQLTDRCRFQYENSVGEALKSACVAGMGIAWLPKQSIEKELADGRLARVSTADAEISIEVRLYRSIERSRREVERFWSLTSSISDRS